MNPLDRMIRRLQRAARRGVRLNVVHPGRIVALLLVALGLVGLQDLRARGFGHPVRTATVRSFPGAALNPLTLAKSLDVELLAAQTVGLEVKDVLGVTIRTLPAHTLPAGHHRIDWDGLREDGREAGPGFYTLEVDFGGVRSESRLAWIGP